MALSPTEEIKDRLDIVEVINGYIRLQKAGNSHKALCPFHSEKAPSFSVSQEKQMWYCFGCNEGGDVFTFLQKIEGMEYADALRLLADRAGVELKKEDPQIRSKRKEVYEVVELAAKFFEKQLESKTGQEVVKYLKDRGVTVESIKDWRLGYAPDDWRTLYSFLREKGYDGKTIEMAGMIVKSDKAKEPYHDRFRHRITFPIFDVQGQVQSVEAKVVINENI